MEDFQAGDSTRVGKRRNAKDTLERVFDTIKEMSKKRPVTVQNIRKKKGHSEQMVRTGIEILLALGLVRSIGQGSLIEVTWDNEQEQALANISEVTRECIELRDEIKSIENEIEALQRSYFNS
jgi:predicted transcriptional regulator